VAKDITRDQAERKKTQAAEFMERIGQPDRAEEFEGMSVDDYAEHRGFRLTNPRRRTTNMADKTAPTKSELQAQIDDAIDALEDAYTPESTREELASAIGNALDILSGEDIDDDSDDSDDSDSDSDDDGSD
jgi:hypothetical protein